MQNDHDDDVEDYFVGVDIAKSFQKRQGSDFNYEDLTEFLEGKPRQRV